MTLHAINQAALVKSTDKSGNSCNMRASQLLCGAHPSEISTSRSYHP